MNGSSLRQTSSALTKGGSLPNSFARFLQAFTRSQIAEDEIALRRTVADRSPGGIPTVAKEFGNWEDVAPSVTQRKAGLENEVSVSGFAEDCRLPRWKRAFDLALVILAAPIWLPLMGLITLFVKFSSAGPAFYRQERIGFRGRSFLVYKFRSMRVDAETRSHESYFERLIEENAPMLKLDAVDGRIIRGGRMFRAAGLDELPQIINVLRGEMSLVGPRPCTVPEFQRYLPWQRERVNAPPGLTGLWQVKGKNRTTFNEMIDLDIFYGKNMSWKLDFLIIWKTAPALWREILELQRRRSAEKEIRRSQIRTAPGR